MIQYSSIAIYKFIAMKMAVFSSLPKYNVAKVSILTVVQAVIMHIFQHNTAVEDAFIMQSRHL